MISLWEKHRRDDRIRPSDSSTIYLLTAKGRIEGCIEMMGTIGEFPVGVASFPVDHRSRKTAEV